MIFQLATGGGKCLGNGTPVLMYDGTIKEVQDIKRGEFLMGPDSRPRKVLSTCTGKEMMYRVNPIKGEPYVVNESHVLSLRITNTGAKNVTAPNGKKYCSGDIVNISVSDYLKGSKTFKHVAKGYQSCAIDFNSNSELLIPPYILGLWLGDGNSKTPGFSTKDAEIVSALRSYAKGIGCTIREELAEGKCPIYYVVGGPSKGMKGGSNPIVNHLKTYSLRNNKHIPIAYLTASFSDRLELLAGLVDTDGYVHHAGFDFVFKVERLANDLCFLARSLGLRAIKKECEKTCCNNGVTGTYYRVHINGDCSKIPTRIKRKQAPKRRQIKSHLITGISVEKIGLGEYYGFELDGDGLFLLGDFTVTHNTVMFAGLIKRYLMKQQKRVLILVHREELLLQAYRTLFHGFDITAAPVTAGTTYLPNVMVYVAMVETANNRLKKNPNYFGSIGLVIVDEAHIGNFKKLYDQFSDSLIIGFTATPISGSKKDPLKNYFQDIVTGIDIPDLIDLWKKDNSTGLVPNRTYHIKNVDRKALSIKNGEFDEEEMGKVFSSTKHVQNCLAAYNNYCKKEKTIIFNCNIEHSKKVRDAFLSFGYPVRHLDGETDKKVRKEILHWFKETPNAVLCNVGVLTAGFDEPSIMHVIVNRATMSLPLWLQMTGRGARPYPGKQAFQIIDMGGNAYAHGDWCDSRDWSDMFHNPPKPKEGGEAPVKECVGCAVLIHASYKLCPHCGALNASKPKYDDGIITFELLTKKSPIEINVPALVAEYTGKVKADGTPYKELAAVHEMKRQIITHVKYKWRLRVLDDKTANALVAMYHDAINHWCRVKNKPFSSWLQMNSREWLLVELKRVFNYESQKQVA
jgi:hypothetical protein